MNLFDFLNPAHFFKQLPLLPLLFVLLLTFVTVYVLYRLLGVTLKLGALSRDTSVDLSAKKYQGEFVLLHSRLLNVRQILHFAFYVFGFCLFLLLTLSFNSLGDSKKTGLQIIAENLSVAFAYAADIFLVFLFLHTVQWFVSRRLDRALLRVSQKNTKGAE